jgi:predicted PurR-regulated permease PerM
MPFSTSEQRQSLLWIAIGILLVALFVLLGPVLAPFVAAAIIGYVLNPGVDWLTARRIPRTSAVMLIIIATFILIIALLLIVVPILRAEIPLLQQRLPSLLDKIDAILGPWLAQLGLKVQLDSAGVKQMLAEKLAAGSAELGPAFLSSLKVGGMAVMGWIATIVLVPVVLFYLLLDWHAMLARLALMVPRRWISLVTSMAVEADSLLAQYLRGQLLVMLVLATYYSVALAIAGFDVALPVGLLTGLLVFIPYIGFGIGLLLAVVAAILQFDGLQGLIAIAIIYGCGQVIEGFYLTPRLVGERIGLHPLAVIFALLAFGQLFGFVGILLALPASAILSVIVKRLREHYLQSPFYGQS